MAQRQFATFYMSGDYLGVDIRLVREICRRPEITPVAMAPDFVRGLLNLRGRVVTVLDLGARLGAGRRAPAAGACCVIFKTSIELERGDALHLMGGNAFPDPAGLLVDRIGDIVAADDSEIETTPPHTDRLEARFISGIVKLDERLLIILNAANALAVET